MKTQIFRLQKNDDFLSARDLIGWSKAPRILIVFPKNSRPHLSLLDCVLLAREANRVGSSAAFILEDNDYCKKLEQAGLVCFSSVEETNRAKWRGGRRMKILDPFIFPIRHFNKSRLQKIGKLIHSRHYLKPVVRVSFFIIALLAVLIFLSIFIPRAVIPNDSDQIQPYTFTLQGNANRETTPYSAIIHLYSVQIEVDAEVSVPVSGTTTLQYEYANGSVGITNLTNKSISIPAGLVVFSQGENVVRFTTSKPVFLAAGHGQSQTVPIRADLPGETGNLPAGVINSVEGALEFSVKVENLQATTGGADITVASPSRSDINLAVKTLRDQLDNIAISKAEANLAPGQLLVKDSMGLAEVVSEDQQPAIGQPGEEAKLSTHAKYTGWYMLEDDIAKITNALLEAVTPEGYTAVDEKLKIDLSGPVVVNADGFSQTVEISRTIIKDIAKNDVIDKIMGQKPASASAILAEELDLDANPLIQISPGWWPFLPLFRFQYEMINP